MAPSFQSPFQPTPSLQPPTTTSPTITDSAYNTPCTLLATAQTDNTLSIWQSSPPTWQVTATFPTPHTSIHSVCFSPTTSSTLATVGREGICTVYTLTYTPTLEAVQVVLRHANKALNAVTFSEKGMLATLGEEQVLRLYEEERGRWALLACVDVIGKGVSFAPGGAVCIAGGCIVGGDAWEVCEDIGKRVACCDWGRGGFIAVGRDRNVEIWKLDAGQANKVATLEGGETVERVLWDRGGGVVASVHSHRLVGGGVVKVWGRIYHEKGWKWGLRDVVEVRDEMQ